MSRYTLHILARCTVRPTLHLHGVCSLIPWSTTGLSALLLGATGATGSLLLQEVLASPAFTRVGEYGRRVTCLDKITTGRDKLEQKVIDYEQIEKMELREGRWDVIFIT